MLAVSILLGSLWLEDLSSWGRTWEADSMVTWDTRLSMSSYLAMGLVSLMEAVEGERVISVWDWAGLLFQIGSKVAMTLMS